MIVSAEISTCWAAGPSGTNVSILATRRATPTKPASTSAESTPSPTPPDRRVSSAISTRPVAAACSMMSGDRQRREPAKIDNPAADPLAGQRVGGPQRHPHAVAERDDRQIVAGADHVDPGAPDRRVRRRPVGRCRVVREPASVAVRDRSRV